MVPFVSIIIPCRNEEKYLAKCLDSVLTQDYPAERFELLLADGMSEDKTRRIMEDYAHQYPNVRWFENPGKGKTFALNILIGHSIGEIIIRLDAHSRFPSDYVTNCVKYLNEYKVDNVGGFLKTLPGADTDVAKAIAFALASFFGVGGSQFRLGVSKPTMVETVPFGCYRRDVFDRIGLFNENLVRNQDNELNARIVKAGGKILLHPAISCCYFARPGIISIARQHFQNGYWCTYGAMFSEKPFFLRHLVPMAFVMCLILSFILGTWFNLFWWLGIGVLGVYSFANLFASASIAVKYGIRYFPYLLFVFPSLHFPYGIGSIWGAVSLLFGKGSSQNTHRSFSVKTPMIPIPRWKPTSKKKRHQG